jgi:ankyrin repeat protein
LHKAAFVGNYDAILRLVEAKAEIDATDAEGGIPPPHTNECFAVWQNDKLVCSGAGTPLHNAIYNGHYDCVCLLLQLGAGNSPSALSLSLFRLVLGRLMVAAFNWVARSDIDKADGNGNCPVRFAVSRGDGHILQRLLEERANPNLKDTVCLSRQPCEFR